MFTNLDLLPIDSHFADFINKVAKMPSPELGLGAALVSNFTRKGHACVNLADLAGHDLSPDLTSTGGKIACPDFDRWRKALIQSGAVGEPGEKKPLILDSSRLYLQRYYHYESVIADFLCSRGGKKDGRVNQEILAAGIQTLFGVSPTGDIDWQMLAAVAAVVGSICIITGGPGTGKTTTIAKILALLIDQYQSTGKVRPRIYLAAPTGKAAARMQEALLNAESRLANSILVKELFPRQSFTIHRLLGFSGGMTLKLRFTEENPLPADVVIVDEASMVDLPLMAKLMQAIPIECKLILLGDRDQLASVEPGAVLGDLGREAFSSSFSKGFCESVKVLSGVRFLPDKIVEKPGYMDSVVELKTNFRFSEQSGIHLVSQAVKQGNFNIVESVISKNQRSDISWKELPGREFFKEIIRTKVMARYAKLLKVASPEEAFEIIREFVLLCPLRKGFYGIENINRMLLSLMCHQAAIPSDGTLFHGMVLMITENHYGLDLFNGDIGIVLRGSEGEDHYVFFQTSRGGIRKIAPERLPAYELCYAMTIHKSQGSEYEDVMIVLPDTDSQILTRELLYTAVTRARKNVELWGGRSVIQTAVSSRIARESGLYAGIVKCLQG